MAMARHPERSEGSRASERLSTPRSLAALGMTWCAMVVVAVAAAALSGCGPKTKPGPDQRPITSQPTTQPSKHVAASAEPMSLEDAIKLIDARAAWTDFPPIDVPRHPAEKYLRDMVIVIDPGHGGAEGGDSSTQSAGFKAGPTGAKEAHMNLRVSFLLRRLLHDAGATVVMTREGDDTISLRQRAEIANRIRRPDGGRGADLFISVHHNAAGNRVSNYSSVWYHGTVDDNEVELDVARYIAHELGAGLRTDVGRTSPVLSSHLMYPGGFGVLRDCHVPAILCESSFYTNPAEEQRLRDAGHNLREAYAIYRGLCAYAYGGRPTQLTPVATLTGSSRVTLTTTLDDGLPPKWWGGDRSRIVSSSIGVRVNGRDVPCEFDQGTKALTATFPAFEGEAVVELHHANMFKHHNWPQRYSVLWGDGSAQLKVVQIPPRRSAYRPPASAPTTLPTAGR